MISVIQANQISFCQNIKQSCLYTAVFGTGTLAVKGISRKAIRIFGWKNHKNRERDIKNETELEKIGFKVIVVWECELKNKAICRERLNRLAEEIKDAV